MLLQRFYHVGLAQASYMVGCQATGDALIIDPNRDIDQYITAAEREGLRIAAITETHIHADFVSGARELAARTGATLYLSDEGPTEWKYAWAEAAGASLVRDGDTFWVGNVKVEVLHTPGHTPEHIAFMITDTRGASRPMGVFTGDFVFVGDVGRPDLLERAAGYQNTMEEGARVLFQSLQRFKALPDYLQVWPAHGAGSACGKALGAVPSSTVGYEKISNWALQIEDEAEFVNAVLEGQPDPPVYFAQMKRINKLGADPVRTGLPQRLAPDQLDAVQVQGAFIVDTRPAPHFAQAHVAGVVNIPADGGFLNWAGWLMPYDRPLALIADEAALPALLKELSLIGLDNVVGYWPLKTLDLWQVAGARLARITRQSTAEVKPILDEDGVLLLDVRTTDEYAAGHIPGSVNIPLGRLPGRLAELPADRPALVTCEAGSRSPIAASLLTAHGWGEVVDVVDGFSGWRQAGYPIEN